MTHTRTTRPSRRERWGALPALGIAGASLAATAGLGALLLPPVLAAPQHPQQAPTQEVQDAPEVGPVASDAPAAAVLREVLGGDLRWGQAMPLPFGCAAPPVAMSATSERGRTQVGLFVTPTGFGGRSMGHLATCGQASDAVAGAVRLPVTGGQVLAFSRGDVIVTVVSSDRGSQEVKEVEARLVAALDGVCSDLDPAVDDARRNPRAADYTELTVPTLVTIPRSGSYALDPASLPQPFDAPDTVMPAGLEGPPAPQVVERPEPLEPAGQEVVESTVRVPAKDVTGPGCGWKFTSAAAPVVEDQDVASRREQVVADETARLLDEQAAWVQRAAELAAAADVYTEQVRAWNDYVAAVGQVRLSWDEQALLLRTWQGAHDRWEDDDAERAAWVQRHDAALEEYQDQVLACTQETPDEGEDVQQLPSSSPTPAATDQPTSVTSPSPEPTSTPRRPQTRPGCPPVRPDILDEVEPYVGPEPQRPVLWSAD